MQSPGFDAATQAKQNSEAALEKAAKDASAGGVKEAFLKQLLESYSANYNLLIEPENPKHLVYRAHMHVQESQCFIFEEFKMWSADSDEYVYIFKVPELSDEVCGESLRFAYDDGMPKIRLEHTNFHHQHMCTRLSVIFICDSADDEAASRVKKCRTNKSFQFSLKGWMEMHTILVELGKDSVVSNRCGAETAKFLKKLLARFRA